MIAAGVLMPFLGSIAYDYFGGQSAKGAGIMVSSCIAAGALLVAGTFKTVP